MRSKYLVKLVPVLFCVAVGCAGESVGDEEVVTKTAYSSQISEHLNVVAKTMVPESLEDSGSEADLQSLKSAEQGSDDICADRDLFECQAILLRFYSRYIRANFRFSAALVESASEAAGDIPVGSSGVHEGGDGEQVHYKRKAEAEYELLLVSRGGPVMYISVSENIYKIQMNIANAEGKKSDSPAMLSNTIAYHGKGDWSMESVVTEIPCNEEDLGAPDKIRFQINYQDGFWKGKVMMHSKAAFNEGAITTCKQRDQLDGSDAIVLYTDAVATEGSVKGALYVTEARSQVGVNQVGQYGFNQLCQTFDGLDVCKGNADEIANYVESFQNPFCMRSLRFSSEVKFNDNCESHSPELASESFSASENWISPVQFSDLEISLPSEL